MPGDVCSPKMAETESTELRAGAELFLNAVPSILIGLDSRGRINRWNNAAVRTFGLTEEEVSGKTLATCGIKWLTGGIESKVAEVSQSEQRLSVDNFRFEKDGCPRAIALNVNWVKVSNSEFGERLIVGSDVTERRRAEDELRAKTAFLEAQIQATIDGILVVDEQASIVWKNQRLIEIFDIPPPFGTSPPTSFFWHMLWDGWLIPKPSCGR